MTVLAAVACQSCSDDSLWSSDTVEEGLPAEVTLRFKVSDMTVRSRVHFDSDEAAQCDEIWVGIYSANTGERKVSQFVEVSDLKELAENEYALTVATTSGECYVVAVGNPHSVFVAGATGEGTIVDDLNGATTFDQFKSLKLRLSDATNVYKITPDFLMCGSYHSPNSTDTYSFEKVTIYGSDTTLPGSIVLNKVLSYNKFVLTAGDNVTITPINWQVCNLPQVTYLTPHDENATDADGLSGELFGKSIVSVSYDTELLTNGSKAYTFDFYQFENMRTACEYRSDGEDYIGIRTGVGIDEQYADREREYKTADKLNSGIYKSLGTEGNDNYASYVKLNLKVEYYVLKSDNPETEQPIDYDAYAGPKSDLSKRIGYTTYTIHLGYCEDKDDDGLPTYATACDFNCCRNTNYTYNVTIAGLNKVIVEAMKEGEPQPGASGMVVDLTNGGGQYTLDAHYNVFNIKLTDDERRNIMFYEALPLDGTSYEFSYEEMQTMTKSDAAYNWISFKSTKNETTLAVYKGADDADLMYLNELADVENYPNKYSEDSDGGKWYTVFVSEYVYDKDFSGNAIPVTAWQRYTNQSERAIWLADGMLEVSEDKMSRYIRPKYVISQHAIRTFYNDNCATALGVESVNENYGVNLRWEKCYSDINNWNHFNGRANCWKVVRNNKYVWEDLIRSSHPETIISDDGMTYATVPQQTDMEWQWRNSGGAYKNSWYLNKYDISPNDERQFNIMMSCMNRNRDENGDGVIDNTEIKWFLPTFIDYTAMNIGSEVISNPMFDHNEHGRYDMLTDRAARVLPYHYYSSDYEIYWAEIGGGATFVPRVNDLDQNGYNLRCVRNLGTTTDHDDYNLNNFYYIKNEILDPFSVSDNVISFENFNPMCLRANVSSHFIVHSFTDYSNTPPRKLKVAKDYLINGYEDDYLSVVDTIVKFKNGMDDNEYHRTEAMTNSIKKNTLCNKYYEVPNKSDQGSWRLPNLIELSLMRQLSLIPGAYVISCSGDYFYTKATVDGREVEYCKLIGSVVLPKYPLKMTNEILSDTYKDKIHIRCVRDWSE
jgi:hypothetical protein